MQKKRLPKLNLSQSISDNGLKALYVLEGHTDASKVINYKTGKEEWTGLYGITDKAITAVKKFVEGKYELPKEMAAIKSAKELGRGKDDVAKEYARYYSEMNRQQLDKKTDNAFSSYTRHQQDVLLAYFHNVGVHGLSVGTPGSIIDAIKDHNEDEVIRRIFMKPDGTLIDYEDMRKKNKRGLANRLMAHMQWWYDPDSDAVQSIKQRDSLYSGLFDRIGFLNTMLDANRIMRDITAKKKGELLNAADSNPLPDNEQMMPEYKQVPVTEPKPAEDESFFGKMANGIKAAYNAMFGDSNQVANNEQNILNNNNKFEYKGNIDLSNRPQVKNKDGSISTIRSISYNENGKEILIPTVSDEGKIMGDEDAIKYWKEKGQNLGVYDTIEDANRAANEIHKQQERSLRR